MCSLTASTGALQTVHSPLVAMKVSSSSDIPKAEGADEQSLKDDGLPNKISRISYGIRRIFGSYVSSTDQPRSVRLNSATVRAQACFAAGSSKRGVVSLLKPCCVPGYFTASNFAPAAFSAAS